MSLVNDMLKDLDARRRESLIGKQRLVPPAGSGRQGFWGNSSLLGALLVFVLTIAAGMAYLLWTGASGEVNSEERPLLRVPDAAIAAESDASIAAEPGATVAAAPDVAPDIAPGTAIGIATAAVTDDGSATLASAQLIAELEQRLAELERQNTMLARQQTQQTQQTQQAQQAQQTLSYPSPSRDDPVRDDAGSATLYAEPALSHVLDDSLVAGLVPGAPPVDAPVASAPASPDTSLQRRAVELSLEELDRQQVQRALQQWAAGQQLAALQALDSFVFQYPHAHQSREALAKLLLQQGERDRALQVADIGLNIAPAHPAYKKVKARILFDQGYVADALQVLNNFVPAVHQDPEYHDLMATAQLADRQYSSALTSYQALLQQDANIGRWWYGMATALEALDRGPEAITAYERATQQGDLSMMLRQRSQQRVQVLTSGASNEADDR